MKTLNMKYKLMLLIVAMGLFSVSCDDDDPVDPNTPTEVKAWDLVLTTESEIPSVMDRSETGSVKLTLLSDNTLSYTIDVDNLMDGDVLTAAHIHTGMPTENGEVVQALVTDAAAFDTEDKANGVVTLTQAQVDALMEENMHYVNVHSEMVASGLLRANVGAEIDWAMDVMLDVDTDDNGASGMTHLRKAGEVLFYDIDVEGIMAGDTLTAAHIHKGAAGVNGEVSIALYTTGMFDAAEMTLDSDQVNVLENDPAYVNVHSTQFPTGVVRGQLR